MTVKGDTITKYNGDSELDPGTKKDTGWKTDKIQ